MSNDKPLRGFKLFLHFLWCVPLSVLFFYWGYNDVEAGKWGLAILMFVSFVIGVWRAFDHIDDYIDHINWSRVFWSILVTAACIVLWDYGIDGMKLLANTSGFWAWSIFISAIWYIFIEFTIFLTNGR